MRAQKLPDVEWNYSDLSNYSDDCVRGIFLYEYFRYSDKLRKLVIRCREGRAPIWSPLSPLDEEWIREATNGNDAFFPLVQQLKSCPGFPDTPALQIIKNGYPGASQTDSGKDWLRDLGSVGAVHLYGRETLDSDSEITDEFQKFSSKCSQLENEPGIEYHFKGSVQARKSESIFVLGLNWNAPDKQIIQDFRKVVLNRRPEQFRELARIPAQQTAFGKFFGKLPFKPISALNWLGVLRRRNAVKTWREFFSLYERQDFSRGVERAREEDCRKAKLILDWFHTGATLHANNFK